MKKILSILLMVSIIFSCFSLSAFAAEDLFMIDRNGNYTIDSSTTSPIIVSNMSGEITLDNVNIHSIGRSAIKVQDNSDVIFNLVGINEIAGDFNAYSCGIEVEYGSSVTFKGNGILNVVGGKWGAAIGSFGTDINIPEEKRVQVGEIIINEGTINAYAGPRGAGIGAGYHVNGNKIIINDGIIHSYGKDGGAGIGCGYGTSGGAIGVAAVGEYDSGSIIINGGEVYAATSWNQDFNYNDLTVLNANDPGTFAAGIGGGYGASASNIQITGGKVIAIGSCGGAGIGGGRGTSKAIKYNQNAYAVNIFIGGNADVTAISATSRSNELNSGGAAIGSGRGTHYGGNITITNTAKVTAISATQAPAIGASKQVSPVDGSIPAANSIFIGNDVELYAVTAGVYAIDTNAISLSIDPTYFGSSDKWFFNENAIEISNIQNVKVTSPKGDKEYFVPIGSISLWANIKNAQSEDEKGNLRIDVPLKMAVVFEDGSVYYGGEMKDIAFNKEYHFQMCTVNWSNNIFDDNNGLRGTVVYTMELVHNNEFEELKAIAKEDLEKYTVKGIDIIDNINKKIIINGDATDTHLETDVNNFFMAYKFHFNGEDYNCQTGIDKVIYDTGGNGKYDKPLESLSVNLPLGSTVTAKAYKNYEYVGQEDIFITIDKENPDESYKDYNW